MTPAALTASILAGTVLLTSASCGGDDGGAEGLTSLDGSSWTLVEGSGITAREGVAMSLQFEGGAASGSGGCNRFTGSYEEDGQSISLGRLASTRMACHEEVMTAERAYLSTLESVSSWSATERELVFSDSSGEELLRYEATGA